MCGILGYIGKRSFDAAAFGCALNVMAARGPDDRGIHEEPEVLLGHRRLAIIDLSPGGHQPMAWGTDNGATACGSPGEFQLSAFQLSAFPHSAGRYLIVFNGEIYNYQSIRRDLETQGIRFRTNSDTEVILASYAHKGVACLDDFRGMFAFAIYDRLEKSVFLARDRMGIKPLYLWRFPGGIAFASEVKALRALPGGPSQLNPQALQDYLLWGSVPEPRTITAGVECLPPATWLKWTGGRETRGVYWSFPSDEPIFKRRSEVLEALRPVLRETVALRCIADVPVGAFLSGGVDSSSVVSLMRSAGQSDIRTFSISFPHTELDEAPFALEIAKHFSTTHTDIPLSDQMVHHELQGFFANMDQPTIDGVNTYLVSRFARQGGLTVALSGLGGDELFAGYPSFRRIVHTEPLLSHLPRAAMWATGQAAPHLRGRAKKLEALAEPGALTDQLYFATRGVFMPSQAQALLRPEVLERVETLRVEALRRAEGPLSTPQPLNPSTPQHSPLHRTMLLEMRRYMHNQLLRDSDVFGMAHGLEIRVPLLDHVVAELLFKTDPAVILQGVPKSLLLDALPAPLPRLCTHRPKMGFTFPFDRWMRGTWRRTVEETLLDAANCNGAGALFDRGAVERTWREYLAGRVHWSRPWALYVAMRQLGGGRGAEGKAQGEKLHGPLPSPPWPEVATGEAPQPFNPSTPQPPTPRPAVRATYEPRTGGTLFLLPEVFHSPGGIQIYTRNQIQALKACAPNEPASVFVLNDSHDEVRQPEWAGCTVEGYSRQKLRFAFDAYRQARRQRPTRIVIGHRNFLPVAPLLRLTAPQSKQWLIVHGIDAWPPVGPVESQLLRRVDRVFAVSPHTRESFKKAGCTKDIQLWPNSVPFFWQLPDPAPPKIEEPFQLLCVSRLTGPERYKGIDHNIRALRLIVDQGIRAELHVVGDGEDLERLRGIAVESGVGDLVHFHGQVSDGALAELYRSCDLFVLPSGGEGFGIVYIEAMAYAKPVIAADAAGAPFAVRPGESGFLVPFANVESLAQCIIDRLKDADGSRAAGLRGREFMLRTFSFERFVDTTGRIVGKADTLTR